MNKLRRAGLAALLIGCVSCIFLAPASRAAGRAECVSQPSKILARAVPYCVLLPPSYDTDKARRYPILYLLHGLGDNDQFLIHSGGMNLVEDLWERKQVGEFLIVTPAAGMSFYINSRDGKRRYEDFFLQEFIPGVEKRYCVPPSAAFRGSGRTQCCLNRKTAQHQRAKLGADKPAARSRRCIWLPFRL